MYESRIAADHLTVAAVEGFPPEINTLAARNLAGHGFLRAAWYAARAPERGRTLLLRRDADGSVLAAIPTIVFGPDGERKESATLMAQFRGVTDKNIEQFREPGKQIILFPEKWKTGELIQPFEKARK